MSTATKPSVTTTKSNNQRQQPTVDLPRSLNPWDQRGLIPWAQRQFPHLRNEFQHLADSVWNFAEDELFSGDYKPAADVAEFNDRYAIIVDLPGFEPDAIDVSVSENSMTIRGSRESSCCRNDDEESDFLLHRNERRCGGFSRTFSLPSNLSDEITATCKNGVLTVTLPKAQPAHIRKVKVNS